MKAKLTFDLSSPDDVYAFKCCTSASEFYFALEDIRNKVRSEWKHGSEKTKEQFVDELYDFICDSYKQIDEVF